MKIEEHVQGAVTIIRLVGPLAKEDVDVFASRATELARKTLGRLIVDGSGMGFVDSRGLETLLDISDDLAEGGRTLKLCGLNDTVREVLHITELDRRFDLYQDTKTAVRSFL